jgi:hypothetical protein
LWIYATIVEGRNHKFGLGGASDFSLKWVPQYERSVGKEDAPKQALGRGLRFRTVEAISMAAFVGVCSVLSGLALAVVAVFFQLQY